MSALLEYPQRVWLMLGIVGILFAVMKGATLLQWRFVGKQWFHRRRDALWFLLFWPGMNPGTFVKHGRPKPMWILQGLLTFFSGLGLLALGHLLQANAWPAWIVAVCVLPGFSLFLHFGIFTLLAAAARYAGYCVTKPFGNPLVAGTLEEFWGKLWNRPFIELTTLLVLRPLLVGGHLNRAGSIWVAFLFSGVLHELAITVPAGTGYGGPTLYFLVQALGCHLQACMPIYLRRFTTWLWILVPLPLVFPPAFIFGILFPMAGLNP